MLKQMRVQGMDWGEDYRRAGVDALKEVLEQGMAERIDGHLEAMAERGEADRRNGSYGFGDFPGEVAAAGLTHGEAVCCEIIPADERGV